MKTDENKATYDVERAKIENAALRKYAAIQKAAEDKIGVQKIYVDITGDIEAAFVLDEIIFYTLPRQGGRSGLRVWKEGFLWMAVQRSEWWDRKRLTPRQADTAISKLQEQNLIFKDVYKFNGQTTVHLRLNSVEFFKRYSEELEKNNPPENDDDTLSKDINDLYRMMGIPESQIRDSRNCETESPFRETESQNGDSINIPDSSQTQPYGASAPTDAPLDWKIGHDQETSQVSEDEQFNRQAWDAAQIIDMQCAGGGELAYAFMTTRRIIIPENKLKGQRKAALEMMKAKPNRVHPEDVIEATKQLMESKDKRGKSLVVTDLFSIANTAISIANQPVVQQPQQKVYQPTPVEGISAAEAISRGILKNPLENS